MLEPGVVRPCPMVEYASTKPVFHHPAAKESGIEGGSWYRVGAIGLDFVKHGVLRAC